ncbi:MAG: cache domain-containing protein [Spirochaetia bacterium]
MTKNTNNIQFISRSTVRFSIALVVAVFLILALTGYFSSQMLDRVVDLRKQELKRLVTLGLNSIEPILERYHSGELSQRETLFQVRERVRRMVYDDPSTRNYLFMSGYDGTMLVQPFEPELEGTDQWNLKDSRGLYIIRELINTARSGSGYVEYYYPLPGSEEPSKKISYVVGIPELQVYLGTGLYLNDIQIVLSGFLRNGMLAIVLVFLLLALVLLFLFRPFYIAYHTLQLHFNAIAQNPSELPEGIYSKMLSADTNSEVGVLMHNFRTMLTQLHQAQQKLERSLKDKDILLKEVHHRVKNNLQIVSSLLKLQASYIDDPKQLTVLNESVNRIHSMSLIHQMIYSSEVFNEIELSSYIEKLVHSIFQSFRPENKKIELQFDIDSDSIGTDNAIICGLIITELVTNTLKHAFVDRDRGLIRVSYKKYADRTLLRIEDNGCGADPDLLEQKHDSLGISLVLSLVEQLMGSIELLVQNGSHFLVRLPVQL